MKTKQFEVTKDFNTEVWGWISDTFQKLPTGKWTCTFKKPTRTLKQNSALHLWFGLLAREMSIAGVPLFVTIGSRKMERLWNADTVKREIYHPVMKSITEKESTAKLTTKEVDQVAEPITQWLADEWKIIVPFPNEYERQLLNNK